MIRFETQIDRTCFGTVRRWLAAARSPVQGVLFVTRKDLLPPLARLLTQTDGRPPADGRRELEVWVRRGQIQLGGHPANAPRGLVIDLDAVADDTPCDVLFLPPYYLVCLRELPGPGPASPVH